MFTSIKNFFIIQPTMVEKYEEEIKIQQLESEMILAELDSLLATTEAHIKSLKA